MKRIIALIGLVLVIGAVFAASALACVSTTYSVCAPNPNYHANGNPPPRDQRATVPNNQGTSAANSSRSPAIDPFCPLN
jgi:hypothetical protein